MFSTQTHRYIFLFGVIALAFGMMVGTVPTSVPQIILMANWLLEMDFKRKWQQLRGNKIFWVLSAVYLIHLIGLIYTQDLNAGLNDVRTKMPLMFLPMLFFSTDPLSKKEYYYLLYAFIAGSVANTLWCLLYTHVLHQNEIVRNASRFMSHIRLGLYLNVAIACCVYFIHQVNKKSVRLLMVFLILYFIFCLYALGLASGLVNFVLLVFLFLCVVIYWQRPILKMSLFIILILFIVGVVNYLLNIKNEQLTLKETANNIITERTPWGTPYIHFSNGGQKENGNYVLINIELDELQREWKRRRPNDTFSYDARYNLQRYETLVRYLASMGVNKDSAAVANLTEEDLENIKRNISNYKYPEWSFLHRRIYEAVNEYDEFINNRQVNGHSLTMRMYFWKAAIFVIKQNLLTGVGTGDVQMALNKAYVETNSPLEPEWYKRPHNQFLTITLALGIFGLFIFCVSLVYPALVLRNHLPKLYWPFIIIALASFLVEDTLETQAGLSFFAFFNSLFVSFGFYKKENSVDPKA